MPRRFGYSTNRVPVQSFRPVQWDRHRREHHGRPKPESQVWSDIAHRTEEDDEEEDQ